MSPPRRPVPNNSFFQNLWKEVVHAGVVAGNRAATAAVRSFTKDSKGLVKKVNTYLTDIEQRCDDVIGGDEDALPDDRAQDVVDAEFEPSPKTKTRRKAPSRDRS